MVAMYHDTGVRVRFDWGHQRIVGIFLLESGSGKVCNGLEMAVSFKWTDSQVISSHIGPFRRFSGFQ